MVCFVKWCERLTSSDSHNNIETESEDNSIVALRREICYSTSLLKPNICLRWVSGVLKYEIECYCLVVFE